MSEPSPIATRGALRVMSTLATQGAWPPLVARAEALTGRPLETTFGPTNAILERIAAGEQADVAVLTREGIDRLVREGQLIEASVTFARSWVGLAVAAGRRHPDISTVEALTSTLVSARAVAYSKVGASGLFFAALIERLGIAAEVNRRAVVLTGFTATKLVSGEADVAIQQVSELKTVAGIEVVGELPRALQPHPATFAAAVFAGSPSREAARRVVALLASGEARPHYAASGLDPLV